MQPSRSLVGTPGIIAEHPDTKDNGQNSARCHDAKKQFTFHDLEPFITGLIVGLRVVYEQAW